MKTLLALVTATALYASGVRAQCAGITSIERSSENVGAEQQVRTLSVVAPEGCVWDAAPTERFVQIISKPASGSGTLTYRVTANPFTTARGAQIYVSQYSLAITQAAAATPKPFRGDINGDGVTDSFYEVGDFNKAYRIWWGSATSQGPWNVHDPQRGSVGMVVAMGSFTGDGHAGYALYNPASLQVHVALVTEGGSVAIAPVRPIVSTSWEIAGAGDFDGDLKADLLLRNVEQGLLSIWFMNGATLREAPAVDTRVVNPAWQIAGLADFDRDGKHDILFRNVLTGALSIWKMNGAAVTSTTDVAGSRPLPWRVADVGDFNGDGDFDILYRHPVTGAVEYHLMDGMAVTSVITHSTPVMREYQITSIADVDGDGSEDVVYEVNTGNDLIRTWRRLSSADALPNNQQGLFTSRYRRRAAPRDFNGDGRSDVLLRHATYDYVASWEMHGTTILRDSVFAGVSSPAWRFQHVAPFSGDLMSDIQLSNTAGGGNTLAMWELAGQRILNSDEVSSAHGREVLGAGDFDGDGNADLLLRSLLVQSDAREVEVWLMAGHAVRSRTVVATHPTSLTFDAIGDFDGDGLDDVVFRASNGAYVGWFMAGNARRQTASMGTLDPNWKTLGTFDLQGDGRFEILQRSPNTDEVAVASYTAAYGFQGSVIGGAGISGKYQHAGDYDGDGRSEILIRNSNNGAVTMWFMSGIYVYSRPVFAYVASPLWEFVGAFEPTPTNAPYTVAQEGAGRVAGPSVAPFYGDTRTSEAVKP